MKRILHLILAAALALTLAAPAAAAPAAPSSSDTDQRLTQVTLKVKNTLGISDKFEEFYGELSESEISPIWNLNWSGGGEQISVEATETGKVLSYYYSQEGASISSAPMTEGNFLPAFPAVSREQAKQSAESFLRKVLDSSLESASFTDGYNSRLDTASHRFGGEIRLNGLPSPLTFSMTVRASDGVVTRFYRESIERNTIGGVPSSRTTTGQGAADALLKRTMKLRLEYVLNPDEKQASLQYLPEPSDSYYVDAQTGTLVNLTELYEKLQELGDGNRGDSTAAMAPEAETAADAGGALSQAEQAGIAKMEGVLAKEDLDQKLQAIAALGLDKYTLASASYSLDKETEAVTARLLYTRKDSSGTWRRTVSCDGKTGGLKAVYSNPPASKDRTVSVTEDAAKKSAEAFLTGLWGGEFAETALYSSKPWDGERWSGSHTFQYAQKENGYFFPENSLRIGIDVTDGSISSLDKSWTDGVAFDPAEGILDENAALDVWLNHFQIPLAYRNVPVKLDPGMDGAAPLMELGYTYFYSLKLSYAVEEDRPASGVDAKSGKVVYRETYSSDGPLEYSDVEDHWAKAQLETLARYGIGWTGGVCQPRKELTQLDLIALLASTNGYRYDPEEKDAAEDLYNYAYQLGMLTRGERQENKVITRGEAVRALLKSAGFGPVAKLQGIFTCSFPDRSEIPADMLSWAALAQGLGMVNAESSFAAAQAATRAEAAVMLYNLMNRSVS